MEYAGPIRGGSAGINSTSFWICPECSACVMESPATDGWQRQQHTAWHDKNRKSPTLEDLQRAADEGQMIEAMWAEIDTLRSALRYLNEWCPSVAPRQAEIDRLLTAPRLPMRSLLQLRARLEVGPVVDRVGEINIAHGERDDGSGACLCGRESYLACPYWPEGGVAGLTWSVTPSMPSTPTPPEPPQ